MTDRELLEFAAKSVGIWLWWDYEPVDEKEWCYADGGGVWSPLTDDGDALRLAVKLRMTIAPCATMNGDIVEMSAFPKGRGDFLSCEEAGSDEYAATRRAIVRAAAEIGKAVP
jgi:hypothetical protein